MADTQTTRPSHPPPIQKAQDYWQRLTEGASLDQLWRQFHSDARQSYALYSREIDWEEIRAKKGFQRWGHSVWAVFQSMLMKLSPARRVLLLVAMVLVIIALPGAIAAQR